MSDYLTPEDILLDAKEIAYGLRSLHNPERWKGTPELPDPIRLKFDRSIRAIMPNKVKNAKGIYIFFLEPEHPFSPSVKHFLYVGRVYKGNTFFKRFYDYVDSIGKRAKAINRQKLTNLWPDNTYVFFYPLDLPDKEIFDIEKKLIDSLVPPLNEKLEGGADKPKKLY